MREIVHIQAGQCGNQIGAKVSSKCFIFMKKNERLRSEFFNGRFSQNGPTVVNFTLHRTRVVN